MGTGWAEEHWALGTGPGPRWLRILGRGWRAWWGEWVQLCFLKYLYQELKEGKDLYFP